MQTPPQTWFRPFLDGSTPWLREEQLPRSPSGYGFKRSRKTVYRGVKHRSHEFIPCENMEELNQAVRDHDHITWFGLAEIPYLVPENLAQPRTERIDLKTFRQQTIQPLFNTLGFIAVMSAVGYSVYQSKHAEKMVGLLVIIGILVLINGLFPLIAHIQRLFQRPDKLSVEQLNHQRVNHTFFVLWMRKQQNWTVWIGLFVLCGIFAWQMHQGLQYQGPEYEGLEYQGLEWSVNSSGLVKERVKAPHYEWWRILTAGLLHGNLIHIAFNGLALYSIGRILGGMIHPRWITVSFLISVITGGLASLYYFPATSIGASGGILGIFGLLTVIVFKYRKRIPQFLPAALVRSTIAMVLMGVIGKDFIDNAAHAGGFLGGIGFGLINYSRLQLGVHTTGPVMKWLSALSILILIAAAIWTCFLIGQNPIGKIEL